MDLRVLIAAQLHQFDVVLHKLHLTADGYLGLIGLIHRVAQQVAQLQDGVLCLVGVYLRQAGDVVEGVEEEVWIDLALQPRQFGLHLLLPALLLTKHIADTEGYADGHQVEDDGNDDEGEIARAEGIWHQTGVIQNQMSVAKDHQQGVHTSIEPVAARHPRQRDNQVEVEQVDADGRGQPETGNPQRLPNHPRITSGDITDETRREEYQRQQAHMGHQ